MKLNIRDEEGIEILYFIFERELKPPFMKGDEDSNGSYKYYNRDGEYIGHLTSDNRFILIKDPFFASIRHKMNQIFEVPKITYISWLLIRRYIKPWMELQLNFNIIQII